MKRILRAIADRAHEYVAHVRLRMGDERPALLTFLFHALFQNPHEIALNHVAPQQGMTVKHFREFVAYFVERRYQFITPDDILAGLDPGGKYALITFDDGYFNNRLALPVLSEFQAPAVFYVPTKHVIERQCFWWDVLYRERKRQGTSDAEIKREQHQIDGGTHEEIEGYIHRTFGPHSTDPLSDIDRTLTVDEFYQFSREPWVVIGNHTTDHGLLPNYSLEGIRRQIGDAQEIYERLLGFRPNSIAYPAGRYDQRVLEAARDEGLKLGITVDLRKNYLPDSLQGLEALRLGRFLIYGNDRLERQCERCRSDVTLFESMRSLGRRRVPAGVANAQQP